MDLVNPSSSYVFDHAIDVHGVWMRGVAEKQGVRFSRAGRLASATDVHGCDADWFATDERRRLRPLSKPVLEAARSRYATRDPGAFPVYHIIEPTSICNRACPFCPIGALNESRAAKRRLDWTDALAYFRECGQHEVYGLSLYQLGEPMLWHAHAPLRAGELDIRDLVRAAKDIGGFQVVNVSTNGDVPNLHLLLDCPVDDVIISIDGTSAAVYDENRPSVARADHDAFARTVTRVQAFLQKKVADRQTAPYVRLQIINKANTRDQIEDFIRDWIAVPGVDDVFVKHLDSMRPWVGNGAVDAGEEAAKVSRVATMPCQHLYAVGSMTAEGVLNACCHDARTELTDGSHVSTVSPATFWTGPFMTQLRAEHDRGEFRAPCATCAERDCWLG